MVPPTAQHFNYVPDTEKYHWCRFFFTLKVRFEMANERCFLCCVSLGIFQVNLKPEMPQIASSGPQ